MVRLHAHNLPFKSRSFDVVMLYEAIYYVGEAERCLEECRRVLRERGRLLICTVNKEWRDFNPSPFSTRYFSADELRELLTEHGFSADVCGAFPVPTNSPSQHLISLIKRAAIALRLIPKTMAGKQLLKRIFLGELSPVPAEICDGSAPYCEPKSLSDGLNPSQFKVLFAVGELHE